MTQFPAPFIFINMKIIITESQYTNLRVKRRYYEIKELVDYILSKNTPFSKNSEDSYFSKIIIEIFMGNDLKKILNYENDDVQKIALAITDVFGEYIREYYRRIRNESINNN